jgi:hypothetical protein
MHPAEDRGVPEITSLVVRRLSISLGNCVEKQPGVRDSGKKGRG